MSYHPIMGILIFLLAVIISFYLVGSYIKKTNTYDTGLKIKEKILPQGEITSPDAPWLNEK